MMDKTLVGDSFLTFFESYIQNHNLISIRKQSNNVFVEDNLFGSNTASKSLVFIQTYFGTLTVIHNNTFNNNGAFVGANAVELSTYLPY